MRNPGGTPGAAARVEGGRPRHPDPGRQDLTAGPRADPTPTAGRDPEQTADGDRAAPAGSPGPTALYLREHLSPYPLGPRQIRNLPEADLNPQPSPGDSPSKPGTPRRGGERRGSRGRSGPRPNRATTRAAPNPPGECGLCKGGLTADRRVAGPCGPASPGHTCPPERRRRSRRSTARWPVPEGRQPGMPLALPPGSGARTPEGRQLGRQ